MKSINDYRSPKYATIDDEKISEGVYQTKDGYVTSLSFEIEPDLGEGVSSNQLSQYPLEAILDDYNVYISDFYPEMNRSNSLLTYLEFASVDIDDVMKLRKLINYRVVCKSVVVKGEGFLELVINREGNL